VDVVSNGACFCAGRFRLLGHPFAARERHGALRVRFAGPINFSTTTGWSDPSTASCEAEIRNDSCHALGETADLAVAQPVVDECEQLAGSRDLGDVLRLGAAAFDDPVVGGSNR
jgi:hypothetical protein